VAWTRQFICFAAIGTIGTAAHYGVLVYLVEMCSVRPLIGSVSGFICGAIVNYLLNYYITFQSKRPHQKASVQFFSIAIMGLPLNGAIMFGTNELMGVHYVLSQVIATLVTLVWNFLGNRWWTFGNEMKPAV
jgi:putative flippase GtrA